MLTTRILHALRRRPWTRRALSLASYAGAAALASYGGITFSMTADMDAQMAAGWPLVGGLLLACVTHEIRVAIRTLPVRETDPIES